MATIALQVATTQSKADVRHYPEAAGQTFKKGEFVYLNVSGKVAGCASDAAFIAGLAGQDATGVENSLIPIEVVEPGVLFEMNVYHSVPGSAITSIDQVGKKYGLRVDSNKPLVDLEDTVDTRFIIRDLSTRDKVGDTYGRVLAEVIRAHCQLSGVV